MSYAKLLHCASRVLEKTCAVRLQLSEHVMDSHWEKEDETFAVHMKNKAN